MLPREIPRDDGARCLGDPPMTYAQGRTCYDADSHIMELPDFLAEHADPDMRERLPRIKVPRVGRLATLVEEAERNRKHSEREVAELLALGDTLISGPKGYMALGAFNRDERAQALDLLGFARQLVFATFSEGLAFSLERPIEERYAAARAHNRAMAEFCGKDPRLMGVALLPLDDPQTSLAELEHILRLGSQGSVGAASSVRRPLAGPQRSRSDLGATRRSRRAVRPARRRRAAADRCSVDEHRSGGADRLARHGRERARQGHDFAASARRDVRRRDGARRRVRASSRAARRRDRARCGLGAVR